MPGQIRIKGGGGRGRKRGKRRPGPSDLEVLFANLWAMTGDRTRKPVREYRFASEAIGRNWRIDFAWPDQRVGVECEGGVYKGGYGGGTALGGHNSATGFQDDLEKYNAANDLRWIIYRYTIKDLGDRPVQVIQQVRRALERRDRGEL